jgi:PAS domain-containing protein
MNLLLGITQPFGPLPILSILLCLVAISWCAVLMPRLRFGKDRFIVGLVGLLSVHQGSIILREAGVWLGTEATPVGNWISFGATAMFLITVVILEFATAENRRNRYKLRLAEANEQPVTPLPRRVEREFGHALVEASPVPMFAMDANGDVCSWNTAAEERFGWTRAEVLGRPAPMAFAADGDRQICRKDGSAVSGAIWTAPVQLRGHHSPAAVTIVAAA